MPSDGPVDYSAVKAWRISDFSGIDKMALKASAIQPPKRGQVAVRIHAVSLNFRDLIMVLGKYPGPKETSGGGLIPGSDGAGVVVEVGEDVTEFKVGDRVATCFHSNWEDGPSHADVGKRALGGMAHGTLNQVGVYEEKGLVLLPASLSFEEAATLTCAPVTAWTALRDTANPIGPESVVLVQGTGGVSVFAAQLAVATGARVIATSSSDDKLQVYAKMGVNKADLINYKTTPDVAAEVKKRVATGCDHVVEVAGQLSQSLKCVKKGGTVTVIGFVGGAEEKVTSMDVLWADAYIRSVLVGSRRSFQRMLLAIEHTGIKPVIDEVFSFDQAQKAFEHLKSQKHVGKVVIKVSEQ